MAFRNGFMIQLAQKFSNGKPISHDTTSKNFPYKKEVTKTNDFQNTLKVDLCSLHQKQKKLFQYYDVYCKEYLPSYKTTILEEYQDLQKHFPELHFEMKLRIKSRESYENKVVRKLAEGRSGNIYDLFASKIILYGIEDTSYGKLEIITDEDVLVSKCYEVYNYLSHRPKAELKENRDYIKNPKSSGYRSLHLLQSLQCPTCSFFAETQIKTAGMHEEEEFGKFSHRLYKNRNQLLEKNRPLQDCVPTFMVIYENPRKNKLSLFQKPFSLCYEEFFGTKLDSSEKYSSR